MGINRSQFKKILNNIDQKRLRNQQRHYDRKDTVYKQLPGLKAIDERIATLSSGATRKVIKNPARREEIMTTLRSEIGTLTKQKEALLIDHGYSIDYLKPLFDCKDCEDTGFVEGERCHCLKNELMNFAYGQSNLGHILSQENFSTYSLDYYSAKAAAEGKKSPKDIASRNYKICCDFAAKFGQNYSNLLLHGQAGLGKTFLCNSIAKEVLDQGHSVIYLTAFHLFKLISEYRFRNEDDQVSYDDIQAIYDCDLLIIDDLGTENSNSFTTSELFSLINSRLLDEKPVVISTNLSPNTLGTQYTDRIVSRIIGNYLSLGFIGSDIRLQKKFS